MPSPVFLGGAGRRRVSRDPGCRTDTVRRAGEPTVALARAALTHQIGAIRDVVEGWDLDAQDAALAVEPDGAVILPVG